MCEINEGMKRLIRIEADRRLLLACVIVAVITLLARMPFIVSPGMSTDSYGYLEGWPVWKVFLPEGRFGLAFVFELFRVLAIDARTFATLLQGPGIALFAFVVPLMFAAFSDASQVRLLPLCLAGLVVTLHPYPAEMLTFSEASFTASVAAAMGVVAIFLVARRPGYWWLSTLLLVGALSIYQLLVNYACLMILFGLLNIYLRTQKDARWSMVTYQRVFLAIVVLGVSLGIYLLLQKSIVTALGIDHKGRSAFLLLDGVSGRLEDLKSLTQFLWSRPLLVEYAPVSRVLLWTLTLCGWGIFAFVVIRRDWKHALLPIVVILIMPLAGIGVVAAGEIWWPAPRILGGIVLVWAMGIYWLAWFANARFSRVMVGAASGVLLLSLAAVGHRVHSDQKQLNLYDRVLAQRVYAGLVELEGYTDDTPIVLVNTRLRWAHPLRLATAHMDLNMTAFADKWALKGLLEISNGRRLQLESADEQDERYCENAPIWPQPGFASMQEGKARVCL